MASRVLALLLLSSCSLAQGAGFSNYFLVDGVWTDAGDLPSKDGLSGERRSDLITPQGLAWTRVYLFNAPLYKNRPATLRSPILNFPQAGTHCTLLPRGFRGRLRSIQIQWQTTGPPSKTLADCSRIVFYTKAGCTGFGLGYINTGKRGYFTKVPSIAGPYVVSQSVKCV